MSMPREREQMRRWNDTTQEYKREKTIVELFEEQVRRSPDAIAVNDGKEEVSYEELDRRANQLGRYLQGLGVKAERVVGICVSRSVRMVVGLLGTLKAGGAYVPLESGYPEERLQYMMEDAGIEIVLVEEATQRKVGAEGGKRVYLDREWERIGKESGEKLKSGLMAENLAYVIYTSGSTGRPKGVGVTHQGLSNYTVWSSGAYLAGERGWSAVHTPLSFDLTVTSIFPPLVTGQVLRLLGMGRELEELGKVMKEDQRWGLLKLTPSHLRVLRELVGEGVEVKGKGCLVIGGEALRKDDVDYWRERAPRARLVNEYGPTETVVGCCVYEASAGAGGDGGDGAGGAVPIGRPIANMQLHILDDRMSPVPVGVRGEIYIGGEGLARGYVNRPDLTAERFVPNPFSEAGGERLYRTGDVGRYLEDGNIEFIGRMDEQVKIRGYRIELGEIEGVLAEQAEVEGAVVVAREDEGGCGEKRLVGYVVIERGKKLEVDRLREGLKRRLPDYMVPTSLVQLKRIPLTANGKVDYKALPSGFTHEQVAYAAPRNEIEQTLADIWQQILGSKRVGIDDNFLDLGGHSLAATRIVSRIREICHRELPIRSLLDYPTVEQLAEHIDSSRLPPAPATIIPPAPRQAPLPLSYAQQRLWFLAQMEEASLSYHLPVALRVRGELDRNALVRSLDRLVQRHEPLRTTFLQMNGEPKQRIVPPEQSRCPLRIKDLRASSASDEQIDDLSQEEASAPFDLECGPLIRACLLQLGELEHVLLITMHHIVSDGWSLGVMLKELSTLYGAFVRGEPDPLPELEVQYSDYAAWQRQSLPAERLKEQAEYWQRNLAGAAPLVELPMDRPRPAKQDYSGAAVDVLLDAKLTAGLKRLSRQHRATAYVALLAGWAALLSRLSGQQEIVIGTPIANRGRRETEGLIGFFANTLALRLDVSGLPTVRELLERAREQSLMAQQHPDLPFDSLVDLLRPIRSPAYTPIFQVMFAWDSTPREKMVWPGLTVDLRQVPYAPAMFDLTLSLHEEGETIAGTVEYATALFERSTVERYVGHLRTLLEAMVRDDDQSIDSLPVLGEAERLQVLGEFNASQIEYPKGQCVHELFEQQVERTPDRCAVLQGDRAVSYRELNRLANQLAHALRQMGVRPHCRVGIFVERSPELVVALLGILKAGAAYVPLDPAYPSERLRYMLQDSTPLVLLTLGQPVVIHEGQNQPFSVLDLSSSDSPWRQQPDCNPGASEVGLTPQHLAYIIYTSGSSGVPKGVMVEHRELCNQVTVLRAKYGFSIEDRILQFASINFDASVEEIFGALLSGSALVLRNDDWLASPSDFWGRCQTYSVSIVDLPTGFWQLLADDYLANIPATVRLIIVGGEAVDRRALARWFERDGYHPKLLNTYGPTEATIVVAVQELTPNVDTWASIGRPVAHTRIYILDRNGQPVPIGVGGELSIGGASVSRGYLNRADLTAERFVPDPFSGNPGARMYKSGDLGRWRPDGTIEFLGRNDSQVKIRGFRIELGEVEACLFEHPGVREAVAIVREPTPGDKRLVAYVVLVSRAESTTSDTLRTYLKRKLPEYMLPSWIVILDQLPLTPSGKLDRRGLPEPSSSPEQHTYLAPRTEVEQAVARIWAELLRVPRVGLDNSFFELGGHSLLGIQMIARIREAFQVKLPVHVLFQNATVASLADRIAQALRQPKSLELPEIKPLPRNTSLPPSLGEESIWKIEQLQSRNSAYNMVYAVRLKGPLRVEALKKSLAEIVRRHEVLRTTFKEHESLERVISTGDFFSLQVTDLRGISFSEREQEAWRLANEKTKTVFDLREGPLFRADLLQVQDEEHWFLVTMHHIVSDGWSMGVLTGELEALYDTYCRGCPPALAESAIQYADYASWQRRLLRVDLDEALSHYRDQFADTLNLLELPRDFSRPPVQCFGDATVSFLIARHETDALNELSSREGVTLFIVLQTVFKMLLARHSGLSNIPVAFPIINRHTPELERLIGLFVNTVILNTHLGDNPVFRRLLRRVRDELSQSFVHQAAPMHILAEKLFAWDPSHLVPFQVAFNVLQLPHGPLRLSGLDVEPLALLNNHESPFDMELSLRHENDTIRGTVFYKTSLFSDGRMQAFTDQFRSLVSQVIQDADKHIDEYSLVTSSSAALLQDLNCRIDPRSEETIHSRVAQHARSGPDRTAVIDLGVAWTFAQIHSLSDELARRLIKGDIRKRDVVAICCDRPSAELVYACLAVLKTGATLAIIDTGNQGPVLERLNRVHARGVIRLPSLSAPRQDITNWAAERVACQVFLPLWHYGRSSSRAALRNAGESFVSVISPDDPAYITALEDCATGGLVSHRQLTDSVHSRSTILGLEPAHRIPMLAGVSHYRGLQEMFTALWSGCTLCIPPSRDLAGRALAMWLTEQRVTTVLLTPQALREITNYAESGLPNLRHVVTSGSPLLKPQVMGIRRIAPGVSCFNSYGVEELPEAFSYYVVPEDESEIRQIIPLGRGYGRTQLLVLNSRGRPAGVGELGDICVRSHRAYTTSPEALYDDSGLDENSCFGPTKADLLRTGHRGRYLPDGNVDFVGDDQDCQVVNGYQVQFAEIEAALLEHSAVRDVRVVAARPTGGFRSTRLEAYIVCNPGQELTDHDLRIFLRTKLPRYMVPKSFVRVDKIAARKRPERSSCLTSGPLSVIRAARGVPQMYTSKTPDNQESHKIEFSADVPVGPESMMWSK